MKLYMVPLAPNPTKVMLYIAEREQLGVSMDIEQIVVNTVKGRHKESEHLARNPFGTLPTLELDDGHGLHFPYRDVQVNSSWIPGGASSSTRRLTMFTTLRSVRRA